MTKLPQAGATMTFDFGASAAMPSTPRRSTWFSVLNT
jgi:hypothetical protein